jgi:hypothetical protein
MQWLTRLPCQNDHGLTHGHPVQGAVVPGLCCSCSLCPCPFSSWCVWQVFSSSWIEYNSRVLWKRVLTKYFVWIKFYISVHSCYFGAGKPTRSLLPRIKKTFTLDAEWATRCFTRDMLLLETFATAMLLHQQMAQTYRSHRMGGTCKTGFLYKTKLDMEHFIHFLA